MASVTKRGDTYKITVLQGRDPKGKQIFKCTTFTPDPNKTERQNKKALEKFVLDFEARVKNGSYLDGDNMTYSAFIDKWLEKYAKQQLAPTSFERTKGILEKNVLPYLGHYKLKDIKPLMIKAIYDDMEKSGYIRHGQRIPYSPNTISRVHHAVSITFTTAVYWQLIDSNPCDRIKPPRTTKNHDLKHFTPEEAISFIEYMKKPYRRKVGGKYRINGKTVDNTSEREYTIPYQYQVFFTLALFGGFRRGELYALNWSDIDFDKSTISVTKSLAETSEGIITKSPKNTTSIRTVVVPHVCMDMLAELKRQRVEKQGNVVRFNRNEAIFIEDEGRKANIRRANELFQDIIKRYNNEHENKLPLISLHGLRHTSATILISQNIDIKEVSSRLGHSNTSTTLDIYTHALQKRDEDASRALENVLVSKAL